MVPNCTVFAIQFERGENSDDPHSLALEPQPICQCLKMLHTTSKNALNLSASPGICPRHKNNFCEKVASFGTSNVTIYTQVFIFLDKSLCKKLKEFHVWD